MKNILSVKNLTRKFGKFTAVDDISFNVEEGTIFGFLGQNGAGKSTTINILATIDKMTSGEVQLDGFDVENDQSDVRKSIGIVFQQQTIDEMLTAYENLDLHCAFYKIPKSEREEKIDFVLKLVNLTEQKHDISGGFSGGMKRRLEIARGLIHNPRLLFLDEPTTGLDPQTRKDIWEYVVKIQQETKMTIFLTTHYLEEAEVCSKIAIMDKGKIIAMDSPMKLKDIHGHDEVIIKFANSDKAIKELETIEGVKIKEAGEAGYHSITGSRINIAVLKKIKEKNIEVKDIEIKKASLDNVFLNITGKKVN